MYPRFFYYNGFLNRVVTQHATLADLTALPEGKLGYKVAAFVRNPYDRAYSGFIQIQRDFQEQPKVEIEPAWITHLLRAQIATNMSRVISAGFNFDAWINLLPDYEVYEPGHNTNMVLHPCHYWTHVNGEQLVGFVGKVEQFEHDFHRFCDYVDIEPPVVQLSNVSEHETEPTTGDTCKYAGRMSRRALDRINELFAKDFELFGYDML
ncbi:sulfotransferase family 2 domain-containing protein [Mesorhizobium kowhaii]|uniref:sulfotransferase family 2 domain-containing protein n=1 Tax=Mesorhizobium kowhaii TaxID=1300272 RepID=UPI001FDFC21A|nr:sulfotransferase family 2 domain-containing protein [Mesorhizobium kowhaii]